MRKKSFIFLGIIFAIILVGIISIFTWYKIGTSAPKNNEDKDVIIEIKSGTSTKEITKLLKNNSIIRNELVAQIYIKLHDVKGLQAGKYLFNGQDSLKTVLNTLETGKVICQK